MKIKITYQANEEPAAQEELEHYQKKYTNLKIHKSDRYSPYYHLYLTIKSVDKSHNTGNIS